MPLTFVKHAQQILARIFSEECRKSDIELTQPQLEALFLISAQPYIDQVTLGHGLGIDRSSITAMVTKLVKRKLVERLQVKDLRRNSLQITEAGAEVLKVGWNASNRSTRIFFSYLDEADAKQLINVLMEVASQKNSSAPIWEPILPKTSSQSGKIRGNKFKRLYHMSAFLMDRCMQVYCAHLNDAVAVYGLTSGQANTLFLVSMSGPIIQGVLCNILGGDRSSISVIVRTLVERNLLETQKDPEDKRRTLVQSTEKGHKLIQLSGDSVTGAIDKCYEDLTPDIKNQLCTLMAKLIRASGSVI